MGAWSHTSFANDDALDWLEELDDAEDIEPVITAIDSVLDEDEQPDAVAASFAVAASEVVAAMHGKPATELPEEVVAWVDGKKKPTAALLKSAQKAIARVLKDSELNELWSESDDYSKWQQELNDLIARLS